MVAGKSSQLKLRLTAVIFGAVLAFALVSHCFILFAPWQLDPAEGAVLFQIDGAMHHVPVYAASELPLYMNSYGAVYNWVGKLFCEVFGESFVALRLVTFLCIAASLYLFHDILRRRQVSGLLRLVLCVYLYIGLLFLTTPLARCDGLGFLAFMLAFWIFESFGTASWSLLAIIALSLIGFLTKQYFILSAPVVISYVFLYRSRAKGVLFAIIFLIALVLTYKLSDRMIPGYLALTLAANSGAATPFGIHSTSYMLRQTIEFALMYAGAFTMCWISWDRQTVAWHPRSFSFAQYAAAVYLLILTLKLGHHTGQHIVYYVQLLAPFLLIAFAGKHNFRTANWSLLAVAYCLTIIVALRGIASPYHTLKMMLEEDAVYQDFLPYRNVLAPPMFAAVSLAQGKMIYDSGQSSMLAQAANKQAWNAPGLLLTKGEMQAIDADYRDRIADMITREQFDLIVTDQAGWLTDREMETIRRHYRVVRTRRVFRSDAVEWIPILGNSN